MTETNFRALCAELTNELQGYKVAHPMHCRALLNRAHAALAQPEPVAPPMPVPGDAEGLAEVFWGRYDQPEPVAPSNKEVVELVARLRDWHSVPLLSERERAAALLERLASDNAGLAAAADSLYADNMSLLDSHHD